MDHPQEADLPGWARRDLAEAAALFAAAFSLAPEVLWGFSLDLKKYCFRDPQDLAMPWRTALHPDRRVAERPVCSIKQLSTFVSSDWIFGRGRVNTDRNGGILLKGRNNAGILQFQAKHTQVIFRRDRLLAQNRNRAHMKRNGRGEWI